MPVYLFPMKRIMDRLMVQYIRIHDYSICLLVHTKIWMLQIWGVINFCLFNAIRYWCHWAIQVQVVWKLYMPRSAIYEAHGVLKPNLCLKYNFGAKGTSHINICRIYNNRIHTNKFPGAFMARKVRVDANKWNDIAPFTPQSKWKLRLSFIRENTKRRPNGVKRKLRFSPARSFSEGPRITTLTKLNCFFKFSGTHTIFFPGLRIFFLRTWLNA